MSLDTLLASYLAARTRHLAAGRRLLRAERTMDKLAKRNGSGDAAWAHACTVAGNRRDERRAAYREMVLASTALRTALREAPLQTRLRIIGRLLCSTDLPQPANDR